MAFDHYIQSGGRRLRCGYTTGTCAALAAAGCARFLMSGTWPETVRLRTPKGWMVEVPLEGCRYKENTACCGVRKDGGDDIDRTHGVIIEAAVSLLIALIIVAASLLISNIIRLSPFLAHWLFGAKYPTTKNSI